MSQRLPALKSKEVIRALEKLGYHRHRQKGSHLIMIKEGTSLQSVIPIHNRDLKKGTFNSVIKQTGLTPEEFLKLL